MMEEQEIARAIDICNKQDQNLLKLINALSDAVKALDQRISALEKRR